MSDAPSLRPEDFGAAFKAFMQVMNAAAPPGEDPFFVAKLTEHFGRDPADLPVVADDFEPMNHPNVQMAIDAFIAAGAIPDELVGIGHQYRHSGFGLSELASIRQEHYSPTKGPVDYTNVQLGVGRVMTCVQWGLYLLVQDTKPFAVLVQGGTQHGFRDRPHIEVMSLDRSDGEAFLETIRETIAARNIYRGEVLSFQQDQFGSVRVMLHSLPAIERDQIVFPSGLLERIEEHALEFTEHSDRLRAAGMHLKRGILLHGPPGVGKTLSVMYLASQLEGRTVLLLTGPSLGLLGPACNLARALAPSLVVLEDVDLVAEERTHYMAGGPLLFELLNQMDGLSEDTDVVFVLTTNRSDLLEPALAARPGRIDQALEIPLPDADCRVRLVRLYARGAELDLKDPDRVVTRTDGASAAFIKELMRKSALFAVRADPKRIVITDDLIKRALDALLVEGGRLTQSLLGARIDPDV